MRLTDEIAWTNAEPWNPVSAGGLAFSLALVGFIFYCAFFAGGWVPLADDANLAVHEAGHPLIGVFSSRLAVYGGTAAQLVFPVICMFEFWRRRWTLSYGLCGIWLGQSLLNVARYVADARAMQLSLVGFSAHPLHDWNVILSRWGLLQQDMSIANGLRIVAWLTIACAIWFLLRGWSRDCTGGRPAS
jgi:hypothetical protein